MIKLKAIIAENLKNSSSLLRLQNLESDFDRKEVYFKFSLLMYGISLVEIMVGLTLGVILSLALIGVYIAQKNTFNTNMSQSIIQSSESAISALISPTIRGAGFCGCTSVIKALSSLNGGGPPPLGTLSVNPSMIMGYDSTILTITQPNEANSSNTANWSPALDASLAGNVEATSDVLVVLGGTPGTQPVSVTTINSGSSTFAVQNAAGIIAGQFGAVSDCLKASVFQITGVAGTTITHDSGGGALDNASSTLTPSYGIGAQFVSLTQTAFFVASTPGGEQSALMKATLNVNGTWTIQALAPGVEAMHVLYGEGTNGVPTQYVPARSVTNWGQVYAVRLGFLVVGQPGSGTLSPTQYNILGSVITVPSDNKLRHVYEMTINLRNAS